VSIAKILSQAPQAEQANKRLQKEFEPRQKPCRIRKTRCAPCNSASIRTVR
jgi:hypothetical protein